jgi:hypothetical protein
LGSKERQKRAVEVDEGAGTQRINGATEGDLYKKPVCTRNGYGREVDREYPRPIIAPG